jgi:CRISPR system Cascade subunit CasC
MGDMVQVHLLTAYPAALLNRDDAGLAKRIPFGGSVRTRISSQCLKKHWREAPLLTDLGPMAHRSTRIFERAVTDQLAAGRPSAGPDTVKAVAAYLLTLVMSSKEGSPAEADNPLQTKQVAILTRAEVGFIAELGEGIIDRLAAAGETADTAKDVKDRAGLDDKDLRRMLPELPASLDTALFGRMVTSDLFHRVDAAVSVGHAFTTHTEEAETDYFTAVDTLKTGDDDAGAGTIQDTELTSGVYYSYAVIDMKQLQDNLVGHDPPLAERLGRNLVQAMATVSPGAKKGSTAPYAYAELVLLERGADQPRTLANAFLEPVSASGSNLMAESAKCLLAYRHALIRMYGQPDGDATLSTMHGVDADNLAVLSVQEALELIFRA